MEKTFFLFFFVGLATYGLSANIDRYDQLHDENVLSYKIPVYNFVKIADHMGLLQLDKDQKPILDKHYQRVLTRLGPTLTPDEHVVFHKLFGLAWSMGKETLLNEFFEYDFEETVMSDHPENIEFTIGSFEYLKENKDKINHLNRKMHFLQIAFAELDNYEFKMEFERRQLKDSNENLNDVVHILNSLTERGVAKYKELFDMSYTDILYSIDFQIQTEATFNDFLGKVSTKMADILNQDKYTVLNKKWRMKDVENVTDPKGINALRFLSKNTDRIILLIKEIDNIRSFYNNLNDLLKNKEFAKTSQIYVFE